MGKEQLPLPRQVLSRGDRGPSVWRLQRTLWTIGFPVGPLDGIYGPRTHAAVIAYQKAYVLERDGAVQQAEYVQIMRSARLSPKAPDSGRLVLVDLSRQVLFDITNGRLRKVVPVSTGGGYAYTGLDGRTHVATTPEGRFEIFRTVRGWDTSYLGRLYYPVYFVGGYAIHGSTNVPIRPVSHGCVRIPLWFAKQFQRNHPIGTEVIVTG